MRPSPSVDVVQRSGAEPQALQIQRVWSNVPPGKQAPLEPSPFLQDVARGARARKADLGIHQHPGRDLRNQKEMDVLQNNITALKDQITQLAARDPEAEEPGGKGKIDTLRQQLQEVQQQRDKLQADVRRLEQQQFQSQKNQSSSGSSLQIPAMALLALSLAGLRVL